MSNNKIGLDMEDKKRIERKVGDLLDENPDFFNEDGSIDVISIAKSLGFIVGNADIADDVDGFILVDEKSGRVLGLNTSKVIGVNVEKSLECKRFTIAHEIGHYLLHYVQDSKNGMYAHRDHREENKNDKKEIEANFFAANLLMPKNKFREIYKRQRDCSKDEKIMKLSMYFNVTTEAVDRRFGELEINE